MLGGITAGSRVDSVRESRGVYCVVILQREAGKVLHLTAKSVCATLSACVSRSFA